MENNLKNEREEVQETYEKLTLENRMIFETILNLAVVFLKGVQNVSKAERTK